LAKGVWFQYWGHDGSCERTLCDCLQSAGVDLIPSPAGGPPSYGVLAFSEVDSGLIETIHDLRRQPESSILGLACTPSLMENGTTWRLLHAGLTDVIAWEGPATASQIAARLDRWRTLDDLTASSFTGDTVAGESRGWRSLLRKVVEAARYSTTPILLTGESGTGKEILARIVHKVGCRPAPGAPARDLVTVDCSTLVPELSGSELFGHERGAFTGAHASRDGAFALADGATLFLDEIGELPVNLQSQLLRAIQEKTYKRVGANVWQKGSFRLVCATNRDLAALVQQGLFRLDLFHRIAGWVFRTMPLVERRDDILPLAAHFLHALLPDVPGFDPAVRDYLLNRDYAGNIRELRQLVSRMANRHAGGGPITAGDIPEEDRPSGDSIPRAWPDSRLDRTIADAIALGINLREISAATTMAAIRIAVQSEQGNLQRAAKRLGVTDRALQMRKAAGMIPD
jgi:transcriptional regulator with GAF, ATPase, and Fis domain